MKETEQKIKQKAERLNKRPLISASVNPPSVSSRKTSINFLVLFFTNFIRI